MDQIVAETDAIVCGCMGAQFGIVEELCERCLVSYADACQQKLAGTAREDEMARLASILLHRVKRDPALFVGAVQGLNREARRRGPRRD